MKKTIVTKSADETQQYAKEFAETLQEGDVVALYGDLGSGKTTFVQGVAQSLGIKHKTQSPTFLLVKSHTLPEQYKGIETLYHLDLYRLENEQDVSGLGISEFLGQPKTVTFIEWAEKMKHLLPQKTKELVFTYTPDERRVITSNHE